MTCPRSPSVKWQSWGLRLSDFRGSWSQLVANDLPAPHPTAGSGDPRASLVCSWRRGIVPALALTSQITSFIYWTTIY